MELGSVTLKRIGFFCQCFPIKHSTHTKENDILPKMWFSVPISDTYGEQTERSLTSWPWKNGVLVGSLGSDCD
jgi:hypothetical protein